MNTKKKTTRKETREQLGQLHLSCELIKIIKHFFPQLLSMLKKVSDPRNQSYITYAGHVLLMVKILSSIFYISSMRKTSEEFNSDIMIENIVTFHGVGKGYFSRVWNVHKFSIL